MSSRPTDSSRYSPRRRESRSRSPSSRRGEQGPDSKFCPLADPKLFSLPGYVDLDAPNGSSRSSRFGRYDQDERDYHRSSRGRGDERLPSAPRGPGRDRDRERDYRSREDDRYRFRDDRGGERGPERRPMDRREIEEGRRQRELERMQATSSDSRGMSREPERVAASGRTDFGSVARMRLTSCPAHRPPARDQPFRRPRDAQGNPISLSAQANAEEERRRYEQREREQEAKERSQERQLAEDRAAGGDDGGEEKDEEQEALAAMLGFGGFGTTKVSIAFRRAIRKAECAVCRARRCRKMSVQRT